MADQNLVSPTRPNHDYRSPLLAYSLTLTLTFLTALAVKTVTLPVHAQEPEHPVASPTESPTVVPTPSPEPTEEPLLEATEDLIEEREAIRRYISTIFGSNAKTAFAIADAESGAVDKKTGQRYFKTWAIHSSDAELSIGLFQINLKSKTALVHYNRIPGSTQGEKIEWLKNPYNNVLFAHWVYSTSNFFPWTTYTNNTYLAYVR